MEISLKRTRNNAASCSWRSHIVGSARQDKNERDEHESLLDLYLRAMEAAGAHEATAA
jgi:hypothetical protein